tara:strand:+ start:1074 stop:1370 length:297 start_codon:yes stop_codon:yes gene_type:complete
MTNKRLELLNEFNVHVSPTTKGVGITILGQDTEPSFHEFYWHNLLDDLVEEHTVTVLKTSDTRITQDSKEALLRIAAAMRLCSYTLNKKVRQLKVVDL